jgi:hypothetical protein
MHPDFADWYRTVHIEPRADELENRWQAIEAFQKKGNSSDFCDAARVFFGLTPKNDGFLPKYREEFKAVDTAFSMRDNNAELQVLAGATLANRFSERDGWGTMTALSLVCGACEGNRKAPVPEIVDLARRSLRDQSSSLRAAKKKIAIPSLDVNDNLENLKTVLGNAGVNLQTVREPLLDVLEPLLKAVDGIITWVKRARRIEDLRQEESDILWWLFGERSRDLDVSFGELKIPAGCLIGAKEIADLTRVLPGPLGVEAYLHKMLGLAHRELDNTVSLSDAVFACPPEWQKEFAGLQGLEAVADLCPVHLAVQKSIESGSEKKTAWHMAFQTACGLKAVMKMKPIELSVQAYRERLFVRVLHLLQESPNE